MGPLLVGYDGRDPSRLALDRAFEEAKLRGTTVTVLVVGQLFYETVNPYDPGMIDVGMIQPVPEEGPLEIQPILKEARELVAQSGVEGTVEWSVGDPVTEILDAARRADASAIVIGSHPHGAFARLIGADTSEEIIHEAPCEVIVVR